MSPSEHLEERGVWADLPDDARRELPAIAAEIDAAMGLPTLAPLAHALATEAPAAAIARVRAEKLEERFGVPAARRAYLLLALSQIDAAVARHRADHLDPEITRLTLSDLGIWVRHFQVQLGMVALTIEILDWAQRYLRGSLLRLGALQFDLMPFGGPVAVYRSRDGGLTVVWQDGVRDADRVDPQTGLRTGVPFVPAEGDERVLDPTSLVLDMHIPAGTRLGLREFAHAIRDARAFFQGRFPDRPAVAACGEAWLLDPQMRALLPKNAGLHALQEACLLYPSKLTEDKTIRRLFGPDITRDMLPHLPREVMTSLHRAVVDHLADPSAHLSARGGIVLWPEHDSILRALPDVTLRALPEA